MAKVSIPSNIKGYTNNKLIQELVRQANRGLRSVVTVNRSVELTPIHNTVLCNASSSAITVTLPLSSRSKGRVFDIKKIDSSGNAITLTPQTGELIDGAASLSFTTRYQSYTIQSDGEDWYIL
jgi:hypothetical protein